MRTASILVLSLAATSLQNAAAAGALVLGQFDNAAQVSTSAEKQSAPHTTIIIKPTANSEWTLWQIVVQTQSGDSYEQSWAMHEERQNHQGALIPYYQLKQNSTPVADAFDPQQWLSLEACALRGNFTTKRMTGLSEGEQCVAVSMNIGARRALLPVAFDTDGKVLTIDLNLRGVRTSIVAKKNVVGR